MKIEVSKDHLRSVTRAIKQYRLRHGPFNKLINSYSIYLYPSKKLSLFLIQISNANVTVLE